MCLAGKVLVRQLVADNAAQALKAKIEAEQHAEQSEQLAVQKQDEQRNLLMQQQSRILEEQDEKAMLRSDKQWLTPARVTLWVSLGALLGYVCAVFAAGAYQADVPEAASVAIHSDPTGVVEADTQGPGNLKLSRHLEQTKN
jgi:hypothetical protein